MSDWRSPVDRCPECGGAALYALDAAGQEIYIRADPGGSLLAEEDPNHIARCRPIPEGTQLAFDDERFSPHACPLAEVIPLAARSGQRPERARRYA